MTEERDQIGEWVTAEWKRKRNLRGLDGDRDGEGTTAERMEAEEGDGEAWGRAPKP